MKDHDLNEAFLIRSNLSLRTLYTDILLKKITKSNYICTQLGLKLEAFGTMYMKQIFQTNITYFYWLEVGQLAVYKAWRS